MLKKPDLSFGRPLLAVSILGIFLVLVGQSGCTHTSNHGFLKGEALSGDKKKNLIVFIHGVNGSIEDTWGKLSFSKMARYDQVDTTKSGGWLIDCSGEGENAWPCLMKKDEDFKKKGYDFFVASYRSSALSYSSNISVVANRLLTTLIDQGVFEKYKQIHFVVHSMGGLIAKRMLILLNQRNDLTKLYAVRSVVFLGTPAQGSGFAALLNIFSKNPQFGDMEPADVNTYIQALDHDWQTLLRRRAAEGASYPLAYCAFENLPVFPWLPWSTIVKFSESQSFCDEYPVGFDRDHIELVKPGDTSTEPYQWVKARILEAAEKPGLFNQKVVIMDGSHRCIVYDNQTYDEGATNGDDIADILQKIPVRTIKEHVHSTWQRETAILAQNPALIIIHYSAFYRQTNPADSQGRFQTFIKAMERNNPKIKYLVYTRASKEGLPEKYKKIKEEIKEDFRRKGPPKRLDWWDITQGHEFNKIRSEYNTACFEHESEFRKEGEERPSFRNSNTRRELLKRVKKLLDL